MEKTLELYFKNETGKTVTIVVKAPNKSLDLATVNAAQEKIIEANCFATSGGDLTEAVGASYIVKDVEPLA